MLGFVLLLEQIEAVTLDHARLCRTNYVSHGFRKDSFQPQAIHYCYPSNTTNGPCQSLGKIKEIYLFILPLTILHDVDEVVYRISHGIICRLAHTVSLYIANTALFVLQQSCIYIPVLFLIAL